MFVVSLLLLLQLKSNIYLFMDWIGLDIGQSKCVCVSVCVSNAHVISILLFIYLFLHIWLEIMIVGMNNLKLSLLIICFSFSRVDIMRISCVKSISRVFSLFFSSFVDYSGTVVMKLISIRMESWSK